MHHNQTDYLNQVGYEVRFTPSIHFLISLAPTPLQAAWALVMAEEQTAHWALLQCCAWSGNQVATHTAFQALGGKV